MLSGQKSRLLELNSVSRIILPVVSILVLTAFLIAGNSLVKELAAQERERMDIWAQATQRLSQEKATPDVDFLLSIIERNNSIPVLVTDSDAHIVDFRNFKLPEPIKETFTPMESLSEANLKFLRNILYQAMGNKDLDKLARTNPHFIKVNLLSQPPQYIYYEDSNLLKTLSWYPYVQAAVIIVMALLIFFGVIYTKNAEQNRVWAGLSKETAHQLGTPISSLMAWNEYLQDTGADSMVTQEIGKDLKRLSEISERFSKVGSIPELKSVDINPVLTQSVSYMAGRMSNKIKISTCLERSEIKINLSAPLFQWVIENLIKNSIDAIGDKGEISVSDGIDKHNLWIEVADTGKGIERRHFKKVFSPGYSTKKRGWGLGLTLAKRIICRFHGGKIFVKESVPGKKTVFRIELPLSR